uniref:Uncharacterized protein n=1 Tax=Anguilla anguilla TaxID=7936 RepID=A0A0E9T697_ANGAN
MKRVLTNINACYVTELVTMLPMYKKILVIFLI